MYLEAISGATDSWGKNFAAGENYKNVKSDKQIQQQDYLQIMNMKFMFKRIVVLEIPVHGPDL